MTVFLTAVITTLVVFPVAFFLGSDTSDWVWVKRESMLRRKPKGPPQSGAESERN